jgi:hypothetical protein
VSVPHGRSLRISKCQASPVGAVFGFGEMRREDDYGLVVGGADGEDGVGVGGDYIRGGTVSGALLRSIRLRGFARGLRG